jgi:hypothetical protein
MNGGGPARGIFLIVTAALAAALAAAVFQVPQPLRSLVIVWLLVGAPVMFFVLRVLKHAAQLKAVSPRESAGPRSAVPRALRERTRPERLRIVVSNSAGSGRYTLR